MAVQPDRRPKQAQDEAAGTNSTVRFRYGNHTLTALAMITHPRTYTIRRDGSALARGDVWYDYTRRWMTTRGKVDHWDVGPLECLEWWVNAE
jgi:hypothetical protein